MKTLFSRDTLVGNIGNINAVWILIRRKFHLKLKNSCQTFLPTKLPVYFNESELKEAFTALQNEQEDLLMMLSDQDLKLREYKKKLKNLGQTVSDEEDLEEDDDLT